MLCDVPYVGKRWVHQVGRYDTERGISYWTKNYRTGVEADDPLALDREYAYYDPIYMLPEEGQAWWRARTGPQPVSTEPASTGPVSTEPAGTEPVGATQA
jgi:lysine 2,3-aminomutase